MDFLLRSVASFSTVHPKKNAMEKQFPISDRLNCPSIEA
jgi:hypothetical protein